MVESIELRSNFFIGHEILFSVSLLPFFSIQSFESLD